MSIRLLSMALVAAALAGCCGTNEGGQQSSLPAKCDCPDNGKATMRHAFDGKFLLGAAVNVRQVKSDDPKVQCVIRDQRHPQLAQNHCR